MKKVMNYARLRGIRGTLDLGVLRSRISCLSATTLKGRLINFPTLWTQRSRRTSSFFPNFSRRP
ncbi:hypothetical protein OSTOST_25344 [Ostertagia ostertagi]